ncbi:hypothetical protein RUM43_006285 [Polyplax serrata]|uniref:Uncharacterized protein n=1 Tax=Polyplax serrata TaxID=468196 RepID=A0AAN8NY07_POLSC
MGKVRGKKERRREVWDSARFTVLSQPRTSRKLSTRLFLDSRRSRSSAIEKSGAEETGGSYQKEPTPSLWVSSPAVGNLPVQVFDGI